MRLNLDITIKDIEIRNPEKMTIDELRKTRNQIYEIPTVELIRDEGLEVKKYMTKVNDELYRRLRRPVS